MSVVCPVKPRWKQRPGAGPLPLVTCAERARCTAGLSILINHRWHSLPPCRLNLWQWMVTPLVGYSPASLVACACACNLFLRCLPLCLAVRVQPLLAPGSHEPITRVMCGADSQSRPSASSGIL